MGAQAILAQDLVPCTQADTSFPVHLAAMVAMKAMRAMKAMKAGMTASGACSSVAEDDRLENQGHEGDEGRDDSIWRVQLCGGDDRLENQGREGCLGGDHRGGSAGAEEERTLQACRRLEPQAQEEEGTQGEEGR